MPRDTTAIESEAPALHVPPLVHHVICLLIIDLDTINISIPFSNVHGPDSRKRKRVSIPREKYLRHLDLSFAIGTVDVQ